MLNCIKLTCFVTVILVVNVVAEDGFTSRCDFNNTLFVPKGNNATFIADDIFDFFGIIFYRGITNTKPLLYGHIFGPDELDILSIDDRVNLTITDEKTVTITLQDVTQDDLGMFMYRGARTYCWELFILDVWNPQNITTLEEFLPSYIDGSPPASSMVRPRVNATVKWLLEGSNFSQTTDFIEQDGRMIIMRTPRYLNAKNVTYRITEDNGDVHEVNLTLSVLYGPYSPLQFNPSKTSYIVTSGDVLPDITCSTDCNPPCEITWDTSGVGNVLSLGKVDKSSKGMYTCQATRDGTDHVLERSLYIDVNDETSFIVAVSILGTLHFITFVILSVFTVCWFRTFERNGSCLKGIIERMVDKTPNRTETQQQHETDISTIEMEHYEGLNSSRNIQSNTQDAYENLMIGLVNGMKEDGFTSGCDFNNTLFVPKGNNATFIADDISDFFRIRFSRGITNTKLLLYGHMIGPDELDILSLDDRVNLIITDEKTVTFTLQDVTQDDLGMFMYRGALTCCWKLFVLDVWNPQNITTFEEFLQSYIDGSPPASSMVRPRVNATATWLLDGSNFSQTTDFMEQDGRMVIIRTPRYLNAKNVTYRITEDNGDVHEVNLTLSVLYGPYSPLQFNPSKTSYIVTSGEVLPDITCSTDCNPPCEITWDRSGVGNVLSLGKVDKSSKGMYTCQATRNGTDHVVERSLYVEVNDETSFIVAVSVLGTMHGITLIFLCVCTLCWYRTSCLKVGTLEKTIENMQNRTTNQHIQETNISPVEMETYENLDRSRNTEPGTQQTYESVE